VLARVLPHHRAPRHDGFQRRRSTAIVPPFGIAHCAITCGAFTEVSRDIGMLHWLVEAHSQ
jgi:hypothetical protein